MLSTDFESDVSIGKVALKITSETARYSSFAYSTMSLSSRTGEQEWVIADSILRTSGVFPTIAIDVLDYSRVR